MTRSGLVSPAIRIALCWESASLQEASFDWPSMSRAQTLSVERVIVDDQDAVHSGIGAEQVMVQPLPAAELISKVAPRLSAR